MLYWVGLAEGRVGLLGLECIRMLCYIYVMYLCYVFLLCIYVIYVCYVFLLCYVDMLYYLLCGRRGGPVDITSSSQGEPLVSPASRRGQDKRGFCRSAAIYHNYDIIMASLWHYSGNLWHFY